MGRKTFSDWQLPQQTNNREVKNERRNNESRDGDFGNRCGGDADVDSVSDCSTYKVFHAEKRVRGAEGAVGA